MRVIALLFFVVFAQVSFAASTFTERWKFEYKIALPANKGFVTQSEIVATPKTSLEDIVTLARERLYTQRATCTSDNPEELKNCTGSIIAIWLIRSRKYDDPAIKIIGGDSTICGVGEYDRARPCGF